MGCIRKLCVSADKKGVWNGGVGEGCRIKETDIIDTGGEDENGGKDRKNVDEEDADRKGDIKIEARRATLVKFYYNDTVLDSGLVLYFKAPNSFTGEDVAELNLHCSNYIINKVYETLLSIEGVRLATNGEFSKRAFLNGKMDLVKAESIGDLINAETALQHKHAIRQLLGETSNFFNEIRNEILEIQADIEVMIDFPDDDTDDNLIDMIKQNIFTLKNKISTTLDDKRVSEKIKNGLNIAIVGKPNAGKSSLLNYLVKRDAAIVSDIAGTTRDVIEVQLEIAGLIVNIFDTAGIRDNENAVEIEGIRRAVKTAENADIKILILDVKNTDIPEQIKCLIDDNTLILINKIDLSDAEDIEKIRKKLNFSGEIIEISIKNDINLDKIIEYLEKIVETNVVPYADNNLTQERYRIELNKVVSYLDEVNFEEDIEIVAEKIRQSVFSLGKITGQINTEEILDKIFSKFCIGK
jgi:tRNA modification GTPase